MTGFTQDNGMTQETLFTDFNLLFLKYNLLPRDLFRSFENARAQYEQNVQHLALHLKKCSLSLLWGSQSAAEASTELHIDCHLYCC